MLFVFMNSVQYKSDKNMKKQHINSEVASAFHAICCVLVCSKKEHAFLFAFFKQQTASPASSLSPLIDLIF
jgi:hypothetical protein